MKKGFDDINNKLLGAKNAITLNIKLYFLEF